MLVFYHSGIWHFLLSIIYHGISLIIRAVDDFLFEAYGAIVEFPELIVVELVYFSCENQFLGDFLPTVFNQSSFLGSLFVLC